jgi:hypothetical protein
VWAAPAHIPVDAMAELVWKVLHDLPGCGLWSPFIVWATAAPACPCGSATARSAYRERVSQHGLEHRVDGAFDGLA